MNNKYKYLTDKFVMITTICSIVYSTHTCASHKSEELDRSVTAIHVVKQLESDFERSPNEVVRRLFKTNQMSAANLTYLEKFFSKGKIGVETSYYGYDCLVNYPLADEFWHRINENFLDNKVLIVGGGYGRNVPYILALYPNIELTFNDLDYENLSVLKAIALFTSELGKKNKRYAAAAESFAQLKFSPGDIIDVDLQNNYFDGIIVDNVLHHGTAQNLLTIFKKLHKVMKNDGLLKFTATTEVPGLLTPQRYYGIVSLPSIEAFDQMINSIDNTEGYDIVRQTILTRMAPVLSKDQYDTLLNRTFTSDARDERLQELSSYFKMILRLQYITLANHQTSSMCELYQNHGFKFAVIDASSLPPQRDFGLADSDKKIFFNKALLDVISNIPGFKLENTAYFLMEEEKILNQMPLLNIKLGNKNNSTSVSCLYKIRKDLNIFNQVQLYLQEVLNNIQEEYKKSNIKFKYGLYIDKNGRIQMK